HHLRVGEIRRLELEADGARPLAISPLAVAERTLRDVDLLALGDHRGIRPGVEWNLGVGIRRWDWRMRMIPGPLARGVRMASGLRRGHWRLGLDVTEREPAQPGGNHCAGDDNGEHVSFTNHARLLRRGRNAPRRAELDGLRVWSVSPVLGA